MTTLERAITKLAALFEYGEIQAETYPVDFINDVAKEIIRLRSEVEKLKHEVDNAEQNVIQYAHESVGYPKEDK